MKIAITTPTGNIGRKLVNILLDEGLHELILLARDPKKLADEEARGAKIMIGDQSDAEFVKKATAGVDALFWVNPPAFTTEDFNKYYSGLIQNAADAITANSINNVVFVSSIGAHLGKGVGVVNAFKPSEEILRKAVKNLTILRPTFFLENFFSSIDTISSMNSIFMPVKGETSFSMIATQDIAKAAAKALKENFKGQRILPLHGAADYSFNDVAHAIGNAIGSEVNHVQVTPEQTKEALIGFGASDNVADLLVELYTSMDSGYMQDESPRTDTTTTKTTLDDFAKGTLAPMLQSMSR